MFVVWKIWNPSTRGEISDFSTSAMYWNLKFLHMNIFSPSIYRWSRWELWGMQMAWLYLKMNHIYLWNHNLYHTLFVSKLSKISLVNIWQDGLLESFIGWGVTTCPASSAIKSHITHLWSHITHFWPHVTHNCHFWAFKDFPRNWTLIKG